MKLGKTEQLKMMNEGQRYADGASISFYDEIFDNPWRVKSRFSTHTESGIMAASWGCDEWEPLEEPKPPKMRKMTREEMLAFIVENRGKIMVRCREPWQFPEYHDYDYEDALGNYEYCYFTIKNGSMVFGEAQNFLIEEGVDDE